MENVRPTATLDRFPPIPGSGKVSLCEAAFTVRSLTLSTLDGGGGESHRPHPVDFSPYINLLEAYHHLMGSDLKPVVPQKIPLIRIADADNNFIISSTEGWVKGVWNALFDGGITGMVNYLEQDEGIPVPVRKTVNGFFSLLNIIQKGPWKLVVKLYPHYGLETQDLIEKYSPVRDWKTSWVRAISWHPTYSRLAIALHDDSIRILTNEVSDGFPYVKTPDQKHVSSLCWKPFCGRELAVGVENGIIIWHLDSSLKPTANRSRLLTARSHSPVTCIEYSANGRHLVSSSSLDNSIYIWETSTYEPFALHRYGGGGVPMVRWSPSGTQIFSNTPTSLFKVWSAQKQWVPSRWNTAGKPVEAMVWMPDGGQIIFASDSVLYTILILETEEDFVDTEIARLAVPVFDLRAVRIPQESTGKMIKVGGKVSQLCISPSGTKLAILFSNSEVITLFRVQKKSPDFLYPLGLVKGFENEYPVAIEFQKNFESGALLSIAWSSTRLQHFPMIDNANLLTQRIIQEEQAHFYRSGFAGFNKSGSGHSHSSSSGDASFTELPTGGGAGDYNNTKSFAQHTSISSPQFKIFSSPD